MYSGTTLRTKSGRMMGVHQRIDRIARRQLSKHLPSEVGFPNIHDILHFEGQNGPDGIKRKSPGRDEPWHFIDPYHEGDHAFLDGLNDHIYNLAKALKAENMERAAFEASWLAHAITDGLTPAHHYPLEEKLESLRGEGMETRVTKRQKVFMPGKNRRAMIRNNWEFWGAKGVMTTHVAFELGIATTIAGGKFDQAGVTEEQIDYLRKHGFEASYRRLLKDVAELKMYEEYSRKGWTRRLAHRTKHLLMPHIIQAVMLGWYAAILEAQES